MTIKTEYPKTPILDKMLENKDQSEAVGAFLDWLRSDQEITLCTYEEGHRVYDDEEIRKKVEAMPENEAIKWRLNNPGLHQWVEGYFVVRDSIEQLLAKHFDIDLVAAEKERQAVLDYQIALNN